MVLSEIILFFELIQLQVVIPSVTARVELSLVLGRVMQRITFIFVIVRNINSKME